MPVHQCDLRASEIQPFDHGQGPSKHIPVALNGRHRAKLAQLGQYPRRADIAGMEDMLDTGCVEPWQNFWMQLHNPVRDVCICDDASDEFDCLVAQREVAPILQCGIGRANRGSPVLDW